MDNCKKIVSDGNGLLSTSPVEVLKSSVAKSHSNGLSTVLVAHFDGKVQYLTTFINFYAFSAALVFFWRTDIYKPGQYIYIVRDLWVIYTFSGP